MTKGMSLEELRANLEGDAQKKVSLLELQVNTLQKKNEELTKVKYHLSEEVKAMEKESYYLFNRCRALSQQTMCPFCGIRSRCMEIRIRYADPKTEKFMDIYLSGNFEKIIEETLLADCKRITEAEHPEVLKSASPK